MTITRWIAYVGDAGLFMVLTVRALADCLLQSKTLGTIGTKFQNFLMTLMSAMGDHRMLVQSIVIALLIAMSLGGHFALEKEPSRRR